MSEEKEVRNSVKLILLNENNELLLMSTDDKGIQGKEGNYNGRFWQMVGGKIEEGETLKEAAYRELFEETGLSKEQVEVQDPAWYGEVDLMMHGKLTRVKQSFVPARTSSTNVSLENLTEEEKPVCTRLEWFSLDRIKNCPDIIYPVLLTDPRYLPAILQGNIPNKTIPIDLTKQPEKKTQEKQTEKDDEWER